MGKGHHGTAPVYHPGSGSTNTTPPPAGNGNASQTGGPNSYSSMYAQQQRDAAKAKAAAAARAIGQAHVLQNQVLGLRKALGVHGFKHRLDLQLANIDLNQALTDRLVMHDYRSQIKGLERQNETNLSQVSDKTVANLTNQSRERSAAMGEATANGAGESDLLRAQSMSLSNWNANQSDINTAFYDEQNSTNSAIDEANSGTYKARIGNVMQANRDREQDWNSYYDRRSEAYTQLGNTLGQQAEYYGMANEQVGTKAWRQKQRALGKQSGNAFGQASLAAGQGWKDPGVSKKLLDWEGHADFEDRINNNTYRAATTEIMPKKPEGAGLRSWSG